MRISTVVGVGATPTASKWRNEIFDKLMWSSPTQISLPFSADAMIPLIHVEDVAETIRRLVQAEQVSHMVYNTPSENWPCRDLADYIVSLNAHIRFSFGPSHVRGIPQAINGSRLATEFGFSSPQLKERLRWVVSDEGS